MFSLLPPTSTSFAIGDFSPRFSGNELGISGDESFDIDLLGGPGFAFGFDFVEPEFDPNLNGPFVESQFNVTLKNGLSTVASFVFSRPNDSAQFVGVWTGVGDAFDHVEIREILLDPDVSENEFFGQFFVGTTPVPEPSGFALIAVAVSVLASRTIRRRSNQVL